MSKKEEKIKEILPALQEKMLNWANKTEAFASEQIPLLVEEILLWNFWESVMMAVIAFIIIALSVWCLRICVITDIDKEDEEFYRISSVVALVTSIPSVIVFTVQLFEIAKITITPRLYLVNYLKDMI